MAVAAVLLIHIDRKAQMTPKASRMRPVLLPTDFMDMMP